MERTVYDEGWDLFGYAGWSPRLQAMVVSFRGTDSHSIYNWAENMRYWRTDFKVPFPGADGSKVHTGACAPSAGARFPFLAASAWALSACSGALPLAKSSMVPHVSGMHCTRGGKLVACKAGVFQQCPDSYRGPRAHDILDANAQASLCFSQMR